MPRTTRPRVLNSNGSPRVVRAPSPRRLQSLATDPAASLPPLDPFVAKAESPRLRAAPSRPGLPPGRVGSERSLPRGRHLKNRAAVGRVPAAWVACDDRNGRRFWHNELTGTSHWVHPVDDYVRATLKTLRSGIDPAVAGGGGAAAAACAKSETPFFSMRKKTIHDVSAWRIR